MTFWVVLAQNFFHGRLVNLSTCDMSVCVCPFTRVPEVHNSAHKERPTSLETSLGYSGQLENFVYNTLQEETLTNRSDGKLKTAS